MVMAKPTPLLVLALAKTTPATWPSGLRSGPPELPGWTSPAIW